MTDSPITALALVCTLKPSPAESSSELMAGQILAELSKLGVTGDALRVVDFNVKPGVEADMGKGDAWPDIRSRILGTDILVIVTPTWMGHASSVAHRVLERLDAELSSTDERDLPLTFDRVAVVGVVGNEDGAHHITAEIFQALNDVGFTIPAQGGTYWNGEAMNSVDYDQLEKTPPATAAATKQLAASAVHLAKLLKASGYPAKKK